MFDLIRAFEIVDRVDSWRLARKRIRVLKPFFAEGGVGVECGVFKGAFSKFLLREFKPDQLILIDPWFEMSAKWDWANGDQSTVNAFSRILKQFKYEIESGKVKVEIGDDVLVLETLDDRSLDWAYVDSSHEYTHTLRELAVLSRKVRANGIIAGDDWFPDVDSKHHGVCKAVREFVDSGNGSLVFADEPSKQWIVRVNDA